MNKNAIVMGLLFLVVFVAGFGLGRMSDGTSTAELVRTTQNSLTGDSVEDTASTGDTSDTAPTADTSVEGGTTVSANNLTDGQKAMLKAMGVDTDNITITPEMVACAEAKLGSARIEAIKNGATPSFSEGATLVACYR